MQSDSGQATPLAPAFCDTNQAGEASTSGNNPSGRRRRPGYHSSRRASSRLMMDLLRAISESAPYLRGEAQEEGPSTTGEHLYVPHPAFAATEEKSISARTTAVGEHRVEEPEPLDDGFELPAPIASKIKLLSSRELLVRQEAVTELECQYCHCIFRLQHGGAVFEGKAACTDCEQQLNRDVVLPAINSGRSLSAEPVLSQDTWPADDDDENLTPACETAAHPGTSPDEQTG